MGRHHKGGGGGDEPVNTLNGWLKDLPSVQHAGGHTTDIERLLDTNSRQASTETEPVDSPISEHDSGYTSEYECEEEVISLPDPVSHCYRMRATREAKKASLETKSSHIPLICDLYNVEISAA